MIDTQALAETYQKYTLSRSHREEFDTVEEGVKEILLKLCRYTKNRDTFNKKFKLSFDELNTQLDRFYSSNKDKKFKELITRYAKDYVMSLSNKIK